MADIPSWARVVAKVVCVDAAPRDPGVALLIAGAVYTIRATEWCADWPYTPPGYGVHLLEVRRPVWLRTGRAMPYDIARFRPLVTEADDVALFQRLVADMPVSERLDRLAEKLNEEATR